MEIKELKTKIKVVFPEESEIFMAEEFMEMASGADFSEKSVEIDVSGVSSVDTVFLQLCAGLIKKVVAQGNKVSLKSSEVFDNAQKLYGIDLNGLCGGYDI